MPFCRPTEVRVAVGLSISCDCCRNSWSTVWKYRPGSPPAAQRANIEAPAATVSSGNSRKIKRTRPVSMYLAFNCGNSFCSKFAQCEQVIEEYSTIVRSEEHTSE